MMQILSRSKKNLESFRDKQLKLNHRNASNLPKFKSKALLKHLCLFTRKFCESLGSLIANKKHIKIMIAVAWFI